MKLKLKSNRTQAVLFFSVMSILLPIVFFGLRRITEGVLEPLSFDDSLCDWIDNVLEIKAPATSHRWLIELLTLPLGAGAAKHLSGAVKEVRFTHDIEALEVIEILGRTLCLFTLSLTLTPMLVVFFYRVLQYLQFSQFLATLISIPLTLALLWYRWRYPNRRLKQVQRAYYFEQLKK